MTSSYSSLPCLVFNLLYPLLLNLTSLSHHKNQRERVKKQLLAHEHKRLTLELEMLDIETRAMDAKVANDSPRHASFRQSTPPAPSRYSPMSSGDVASCSAAVVGRIDDLTRAVICQSPPTGVDTPTAVDTPPSESYGARPSLAGSPMCVSAPEVAQDSSRIRHATYVARSASSVPPPGDIDARAAPEFRSASVDHMQSAVADAKLRYCPSPEIGGTVNAAASPMYVTGPGPYASNPGPYTANPARYADSPTSSRHHASPSLHSPSLRKNSSISQRHSSQKGHAHRRPLSTPDYHHIANHLPADNTSIDDNPYTPNHAPSANYHAPSAIDHTPVANDNTPTVGDYTPVEVKGQGSQSRLLTKFDIVMPSPLVFACNKDRIDSAAGEISLTTLTFVHTLLKLYLNST